MTTAVSRENEKPLHPLKIEGSLKAHYPRCHALIDPIIWSDIEKSFKNNPSHENFKGLLAGFSETGAIPPYLPELSRVERRLTGLGPWTETAEGTSPHVRVNPSLEILDVSWQHLDTLFTAGEDDPEISPAPGQEMLILWRDPRANTPLIERASEEALLALKMVIEELDPAAVARQGSLPIGAIDQLLDRAVYRGLVLRPPSLIRRPPVHFQASPGLENSFSTTDVFTLQWHITQACDQHCRHCYDRSNRSTLEFDQAIMILDDFRAFCRSRYARGQVSFTGGNPLLYPGFNDLYHAASERGLSIAILGNPASRERIEELTKIQHPVFYQVSLEGLRDQNDYIRGPGHFERVMAFLKVLSELKIYSMVMLTLTRDNMEEILPLADLLRERVDHFTFNRLSMVGEGAALKLPAPMDYAAFLGDYVNACENNPILGLKDNLINILLHRNDQPLMGGCTGFGCGAAFNFLTLLPDGEVHACRKFPSSIGNISEQDFSGVYESEPARRYRAGSDACRSCVIRPVCGGCLACTYSHGISVFEDRDPFCFFRP